MSQTLEFIFKNQLEKPVKFQITKLNATVTKEQAKSAMEAFIQLNILEPKSGKPTQVSSAQIVDKNIHVLF
ncbi:DUF2922 domain-containing protein [Staphylococcus massiliensis]|uniref:DUF2922 domain-containing protein n=1 Tax=Staphylococcus massiliensis S46 TaxID=1229783 RepID=K9AFA7_9STAP|nr:DUF2922 domain-containing protein [Staphylococcus massiliensis]EKU46009.1 hypothetical protein C273_10122 [Staphylococcus massiliensis S46]MCG3400277.1 DUF2922 domain-containing protein [Staphylococcus massiliensis]MCG3401907.1 DUF2922 domain-containing protein [Staphylococcus massiliensis]MCG3412431.1 DUF2922 domain-containing protein [Staphylococcus massiliensis]PNZ97579.1 DUF2922 domain-containing protein [Staphylococcus massiliensis CCUG 55927]